MPARSACGWRLAPNKRRQRVTVKTLELDDELCLCFHVTKRKVINYIRVEKPRRPGQLSDCFGAGTGCGWCRTYLRRLFDEARGIVLQVRSRRVRRSRRRRSMRQDAPSM